MTQTIESLVAFVAKHWAIENSKDLHEMATDIVDHCGAYDILMAYHVDTDYARKQEIQKQLAMVIISDMLTSHM